MRASSVRRQRLGFALCLLLPLLLAAPTSAKTTVTVVNLPIPLFADSGCEQNYEGGACIVAASDGGALVFGVGLTHVAPDGTSTILDSRPFGEAHTAPDGTTWALWGSPCLICDEMHLVHFDADGSLIAEYLGDTLLDPGLFEMNTRLLAAAASGVWISNGAGFLAFVAEDGTPSGNLYPLPPSGGEVKVSHLLADPDSSATAILATRQKDARWRSSVGTLATDGTWSNVRPLPKDYLIKGMALSPDGSVIVSASAGEFDSPTLLRERPDGTFARIVIPQDERMWRNAGGNPVLLANGDAYLPVEVFKSFEAEWKLVGQEVWGLVGNHATRVFAFLPGPRSGSVIGPLATDGTQLVFVAGKQGADPRSIVGLVRGTDLLSRESTSYPPGWPAFGGDGTVWWFPLKPSTGTEQPIFHRT